MISGRLWIGRGCLLVKEPRKVLVNAWINPVNGSTTISPTPPLKILPQHPANHKPTRRINMFWLNGVVLGKISHRARHFG